MSSRAMIDEFLSQRSLAVVGVSRKGRKFGNSVFRDLTAKGYRVFPVNPNVEKIEGQTCYPDLSSLPEPVGGVVIVVPPEATEKVVRDAKTAGISRVWMQQGAESEEAIRYCEENGIQVVHGECVMMFSEPVGFGHRVHRWLRGVSGRLPK